jgi:hypothetical protein
MGERRDAYEATGYAGRRLKALKIGSRAWTPSDLPGTSMTRLRRGAGVLPSRTAVGSSAPRFHWTSGATYTIRANSTRRISDVAGNAGFDPRSATAPNTCSGLSATFVKGGGLRLLSKPAEQFLHPAGRPLLDRGGLRLAVHRTGCS